VFELEVKRPMAVIYLDCSESTMEKRVKALGNNPFPDVILSSDVQLNESKGADGFRV
jgi:hypothetical protein